MAAIADSNQGHEPAAGMQEFTLRIRRYNPESGEAPYWDEHTIELEPHRSVLEGLLQAKARFDGSIDLTSAGSFRMGDVVVTSAARESVTAELTGLAPGDRVQWIVSGASIGVTTASGPSLALRMVASGRSRSAA